MRSYYLTIGMLLIKYVTIKCYIIILGQNETDNLTANASS
jgi:hypothetical protein